MRVWIVVVAVVIVTTVAFASVAPALDHAAEKAAASMEVTEISHRRTPCHGTCPVYSLTFSANGQAVFRGEDDVTPLGEHTGVIDHQDFERLVTLANAAHFFELHDAYDQRVNDLPFCYTRLTRGTQSKEVASRCASLPKDIPGGRPAPSGLLRLEDVIDEIRQHISWKTR